MGNWGFAKKKEKIALLSFYCESMEWEWGIIDEF